MAGWTVEYFDLNHLFDMTLSITSSNCYDSLLFPVFWLVLNIIKNLWKFINFIYEDLSYFINQHWKSLLVLLSKYVPHTITFIRSYLFGSDNVTDTEEWWNIAWWFMPTNPTCTARPLSTLHYTKLT